MDCRIDFLQLFGGRGSSSASGGGGGIGGGGVASGAGFTFGGGADDDAAIPQAPASDTMSADYNKFQTMTDDEKADVIDSLIAQAVPAHLSDSDFQRFTYNLGLNDKPKLVDDATLDKMQGREIYRTVNNVYDRANDISYSADQICKQIQGGRVTRTSDTGGSVYGRGIYFADSRSSSGVYGNTRGNVKKTAVVRAKINSDAKVIRYSSASNGVAAEIASGSKLGKALRKCDRESAVSIYAMSKGYNVIDAGLGSGYYVVLNRQAMTMSKTISAK